MGAIENFWKNFRGSGESFFRIYILQKFSAKAGKKKNFLVCIRSKNFKDKKRQHYTARMLLRLSFFVADNFFYALAWKNFTQQP